MSEYRGAAIGGLTTGIIGSALGLMNSGGLGGLFNMGNCNSGCGDNALVNRYEFKLEQDNAAKDSKIALLESSIYVDGKLNDFRNYVDGKFARVEHELCDQRVFNNTAINNISCVQGQVAQLMGLTKTVIPNANICPGWGDVTVSVATTPTTGA